jgi:hypothetical protein
MKHALGSAGGPQNGLPQYQPIMPPTTKPTGPAVSKPVPAPKTAPTLSAREVVGPRAIIKIGAAASKVLRMVIPRKAKWEVEHKSPVANGSVIFFRGSLRNSHTLQHSAPAGTRKAKCCDLGRANRCRAVRMAWSGADVFHVLMRPRLSFRKGERLHFPTLPVAPCQRGRRCALGRSDYT